MSRGEPSEDPFVREIRRQAARACRRPPRTFWQGLGAAGAVGWTVSLPPVLGALLGRWLDARSASGPYWTLTLLVLGLAVGCASAWRRVRQELRG